MIQIFHWMTTIPTTNNIYFSIVECTDLASGNTEYHYSFVEYKDGWITPIMDGYEMEVMAWCELENPAKYFQEKARILTM